MTRIWQQRNKFHDDWTLNQERKDKRMDEKKQKLIDEVEEQAIQYDMEYTG